MKAMQMGTVVTVISRILIRIFFCQSQREDYGLVYIVSATILFGFLLTSLSNLCFMTLIKNN
jgi:hypothetical protein